MNIENLLLKRQISRVLVIAAIWFTISFALPACIFTLASGEGNPSGQVATGPRPAVVVELFTSEGCSSCPPADKILSWLGQNQPLAGIEIIPLSEHVDYWNHLGWSDPYSSPEFTQRQREYSESLHTGTYTPQMVVDGKVGFVGGDKARAMEAISSESRAPQAAVRIQPANLENSTGQGKFTFSVEVGQIPVQDTKKKSLVFLAVTENNLRSNVVGGENSGQSLAHTAVVRELKQIGKLETSPEASFHAQPQIVVSKDWKREDLRAVVFVQLQGSHKILGAAASPFPGH
ncbi:MAG TPA: DUF1223 domain-containing protein [Terriglobia bacterium]|nr:DUF1223 domain-containing protein [Terriglobia bacterium]